MDDNITIKKDMYNLLLPKVDGIKGKPVILSTGGECKDFRDIFFDPSIIKK